MLDEALFACNALLAVHGTTPYEALFGRTPQLLRDLDTSSGPASDDISGGRASRHIHRLREISLTNIIQGHAEERLRIATNSRTRPAIQTLDLKVGDQVEFYRDPPNKDVTGWRGPAPVVSLDRVDEGIVEVRWQSRVLPVRMPDLRRAIAYLVFQVSRWRRDFPECSPWQLVVYEVEELNAGNWVSLGLEKGIDRHWRIAPATNIKSNRRLFQALMHVAANDLHMRGVVTARIGFGTQNIPPGTGHTGSIMYWWYDRTGTDYEH